MLRIDIAEADRIATLTLDRPEKRNALSLEFMSQLTCALADIGERSDVGVVILAANGPVFSSGHDLSELVDRSARDYQRVFDQCVELMAMIQRIPQPVIAMVRGVATAAGCQLVATCDLAFAEEGASFGTPGVKIGLFCSTPMHQESRQIEVSLTRKAAEMSAPGQRVHRESRGIGHLRKEDTVAWEVRDARRVVPERQCVIAVQVQAQMRMIRALNNLPGVCKSAHVHTPGKGFVRDSQIAAGGPLGEFVQL